MKWYRRVTVQAALITGAAAVIAAIILAITTLAIRSGDRRSSLQSRIAEPTESRQPTGGVPPWAGFGDVLLVADLSPSMVGTPLGDAVAEYVRGFDPRARVGLAIFDETVRFVLSPGRYPISDFNRHLRVNPAGRCTDLYAAVRESMESLRASAAPSPKLVLFSDALPEPCGPTPSRSSSWEFEKNYPNINVEIVLLGKGDVKETQRLFPYATVVTKYVGIGGRLFPRRP